MNEKYLISIIIPIYNAEKYLPNTIDSIIRQSIGFENLELILIDDKSTDKSKHIIEKYASKYKNIKPIYLNKNSGKPGYARNKGLEIASSDYIMFIDNDDEYEIDICEQLYSTITKNKCDLVKCTYNTINPTLPKNPQIKNNFSKKTCLNTEDALYNLGSMVWDKIFKKSIIDNNNISFVSNLIEDQIFCLEYCIHSNSIIFLEEYYGIKHYDRDRSLSKSNSYNSKMIETYYYKLNLLKNINIDINKFFSDDINGIFITRIKLDEINWDSTYKVLNELYLFEKKIDFNNKYNESKLRILNFFILKKHITIGTIILMLLNRIYHKKIIIRTYRKLRVLLKS